MSVANNRSKFREINNHSNVTGWSGNKTPVSHIQKKFAQTSTDFMPGTVSRSPQYSDINQTPFNQYQIQKQDLNNNTTKRQLEISDSEELFQSFQDEKKRTTGAFPMRSIKSRSPTSHRDMLSPLRPIIYGQNTNKDTQDFKQGVKQLALNQMQSIEQQKYEEIHPESKFNQKVMGILQSKHNARKRSPVSGMGGGAVGTNPSFVPVVPKKTHYLNEDLNLHTQQREKSLQKNTVTQKASNQHKSQNTTEIYKQQKAFNALVIDHFEKREESKAVKKFEKQVNSHYEWLETAIQSDSLEKQRIKRKIYEFSTDKQLLLVISKIWFAILHLNYGRMDINNHTSSILTIPLNTGVYKVAFQLIIKALKNSLLCSDEFLVCNDQNFKKSHVFFERFRYDVCSLVSDHIDSGMVQPDTFEVILRQVYKKITFIKQKDKIQIRKFGDIGGLPPDTSFLASLASSPTQLKNNNGQNYEEDDSFEMQMQKIRRGSNETELDNENRGQQLQTLQNSLNNSFDSSIQSPRAGVIEKSSNVPLKLEGFKLEKIDEVLALPDNQEHLKEIMRNAEVFNPNDQQNISNEIDERKQAHFNPPECKKKHKPNMNYHVKANRMAGQKERIEASDKIVNDMRWKQYTRKAKTRDTGTDFQAQIDMQPTILLGDYSVKQNGPQGPQAKRFDPIRHKEYITEDVQMPDADPKNQFVRGGVSLKPPSHQKSSKSTYDKLMYGVYKGAKAEHSPKRITEVAEPSDYQISRGKHLNNDTGLLEQTFEVEEQIQHRNTHDTKIKGKNSGADSLVDDASLTEQERNMSPAGAEDRTNIVAEDYLRGEKVHESDAIHVVEPLNDSGGEEQRDEQNRESAFRMKAGDMHVNSSQKLPTEAAGSIQDTNQAQDQQLEVSALVEDVDQSRNINQHLALGSVPTNLDEGVAMESGMRQQEPEKQGQSEVPHKLGLDGQSIGSKNSQEMSLGSIQQGADPSMPETAQRAFQEDVETVRNTKTAAEVASRNPTASVDESKRKQVFSRVSSRELDVFQNQLGKSQSPPAQQQDAKTDSHESLKSSHSPKGEDQPGSPSRSQLRAPVFSKSFRNKNPLPSGQKSITPTPGAQKHIHHYGDDKLSLDTGFDIGLGDRITTRDEDSNFKLVVSARRDMKQASVAETPAQKKLAEQKMMEKYKKFEKINLMSRMICEQLPGVDGYKLSQQYMEPIEPPSPGIILDLGITQDPNNVLNISHPPQELSIGLIQRQKNNFKKQGMQQHQSPQSRNLPGQQKSLSKRNENKEQKLGPQKSSGPQSFENRGSDDHRHEMDLDSGNPLFAQIGDALLAQVKLSMDPFGEANNLKSDGPTASPFQSGTPSPKARVSQPQRENTTKNLILVNENGQFLEQSQMPTRQISNNNQAVVQGRMTTESTVSRSKKPQAVVLSPITAISTQRGMQETLSPITPLTMPRQKPSFIRQRSLDQSSAYSNQQTPGAMRQTHEPGTVNRQDYAEHSNSRDGSQERQLRPELGVKVVPQEPADMRDSSYQPAGTLESPATRLTKTPELSHYDNDQEDRDRTVQLADTLYSTLKKQSPEALKGNQNLKNGIQLQQQLVTAFGRPEGYDDPLDQIIDERENTKSPGEQVQELQSLMMDNRNSGKHMDQRVFARKPQSNQGSSPKTRGSKTVSPGQLNNKPEIAVEIGKKQQRANRDRAQIEGLQTSRPRNVKLEERHGKPSAEPPKTDRAPGSGPVVDTRLLFQRKAMQNMISQNRKAVRRQRIEQNDLRRISQYEKVQKQYVKSEMQQESLAQSSKRKNAGNHAEFTPLVVSKPGSKEGTGTMLDDSAISAISYVPNAESQFAQIGIIQAPRGITKHSTIHPVKSRSTKASKSLSKEEPSHDVSNMASREATRQEQQTSPMDQHPSQRENFDYAQNSPGSGSPIIEQHSSLRVDNSFKNSIQTMQSGALDQKFIRTRNDQFLGEARDRSHSPPWNAINQGQAIYKDKLDAQSSDRGQSRLEGAAPEQTAVGLSEYLSYRKLEPNPAALNHGYYGQKAKRNDRGFKEFTETSSGVDQDLIAEFLQLNESLINSHFGTAGWSPYSTEEEKEQVQGLMQQIKYFQDQLIKGSRDFPQGGQPSQLPVVIPQPLSSNQPTNNSISQAEDSKELSQALGKDGGSKTSKKSTDSPYLTDKIVLGPAGLAEPGEQSAAAGRLKMPSPGEASELVSQFQYLQSLYMQRRQAQINPGREAKHQRTDDSVERTLQSNNGSAERFGPEGESQGFRQRARLNQNSKRPSNRHRQIKLASMKTTGRGDAGEQDEVGSPGSPGVGPAITQSQYEHDPVTLVSRKLSLPTQEPFPDYQHATERNQSMKLSPRVATRKDADAFAPTPKQDTQSTKRVSQHQLLNTDLSIVSHTAYGDQGTAEKKARKRKSGLHQSLSKQSTRRDVRNEGSNQSATRKNNHPFKNPKVIAEANSEGREESQPELLASKQEDKTEESFEKRDLNHRSSSESGGRGDQPDGDIQEPTKIQPGQPRKLQIEAIEVIPERGSDVQSEHAQSRLASANIQGQAQKTHKENTPKKNISGEKVINAKSGRSPVRLSKSPAGTNEDLVDLHKVDSKTDISASRPHQYKSKSSTNSRDMSSSRGTNQKEYLDKIQIGDPVLQLHHLNGNHIQSNVAMTSANHSSHGGLNIESQLMQPNYSHLQKKETIPIHEVLPNSKESDLTRLAKEKKAATDRRAPLNRISIKPLHLDNFHKGIKQNELMPSSGKKIKTTIPHKRNQRVPDLVSPGYGAEAPHTPTLGGGRGTDGPNSTPFNIETAQSGQTAMTYSVGPGQLVKNTDPSLVTPGAKLGAGGTSGRSSAASRSLNSPHSEVRNRREGDPLLGNALMVDTHQNLNELGPQTEAQFGPDEQSENEVEPGAVQPISPIGYNVSINMQHRSTGPLQDPGLRAQRKPQDLDGYAPGRKKRKRPILMPQFEMQGGEPVNRNFLALLGKDTGKELFEKQQAKIREERQAKEAREAQRFSKRRTSGFNNELIQFAEQQHALGLTPKATQFEDDTTGSRGPVAFVSSNGKGPARETSLDKNTLMRNFVSARQNQNKTTKLVTIPNERLPNGNISKRYWQFNKQMSPRVLPGQAQVARVAFGAKPTLPKLGDEKQYKTICGTFHQKSNSVSITQKLKAVDALIREGRGETTPRSRKFSHHRELGAHERSGVVEEAREGSDFSQKIGSAAYASQGWRVGQSNPGGLTPSIHDSKRASAVDTNWNHESLGVQRNANLFQHTGSTNQSETSSKNIVITLQPNTRMPGINKVSNQNFGFSTMMQTKIQGSGSGMPKKPYDARLLLASHLSSEAQMNPSLEALQQLRQPKWGPDQQIYVGGARTITPSVSGHESGAIRTPVGDTMHGTALGNNFSKQSDVSPTQQMKQNGQPMRTPGATRTPVKLTSLPLREASQQPFPAQKALSNRDVLGLTPHVPEQYKVTEVSVSNSEHQSKHQSNKNVPRNGRESSNGPGDPSFGRPTPGQFTPNKDIGSLIGGNQTLPSRGASDNEPNSALYVPTKSDVVETPNSQI